jgi:hypothetical protein
MKYDFMIYNSILGFSVSIFFHPLFLSHCQLLGILHHEIHLISHLLLNFKSTVLSFLYCTFGLLKAHSTFTFVSLENHDGFYYVRMQL